MRYVVSLHSRPSPASTYYETRVEVYADSPEDARERALTKLKVGAFPDYPRSAWVVDSIEVR